MTNWKRPRDFEDWANDKAQEVSDAGEILGIEEAFLSGAPWAALVAEGRANPRSDD